MTDRPPPHDSPASAGPDHGQDWAGLRERVRELIRTELDKLHPTDDARRALELIVESSLRYGRVDGHLRITVVDREGKPRTISKDGRIVGLTIPDLLDELRLSHPILFKDRARPAEAAHHALPPSETPDMPLQEQEPPTRDWLNIGNPSRPSRATYLSRRPGSTALFRLRRGVLRLYGRSRRALGSWSNSAATDYAARFHAARGAFPLSFGRVRDAFDGLWGRLLPRRPSVAVGAVALAALLAIGAWSLSGRDAPSPSDAGEPATTGTVPAPPTPEPPAAPVRARTLRGVPDVIDTTTLSLEGEVVRLFGVEWAPGGGEPDDLSRYLGGREVICDPAGPNDTYRCQVGEQDLSRVVLFNGGGRPTPEATPELKAAAEKAREAKIGVWKQESGVR